MQETRKGKMVVPVYVFFAFVMQKVGSSIQDCAFLFDKSRLLNKSKYIEIECSGSKTFSFKGTSPPLTLKAFLWNMIFDAVIQQSKYNVSILHRTHKLFFQ